VLFGGDDGHRWPIDETWEWDGATWRKRNPPERPTKRQGHAMAYDAGREVIVLFGGEGISGAQADTWEWNGQIWIRKDAAGFPAPRRGHAMAFDDSTGRVSLFGGLEPRVNVSFGDLWTLRARPSA
ncbi:MAG: kelch repeat-containing protein, partial [Actinomycetota bacterium]|nr:kelch repeat-containing protein [Actinomycetota bacterium]